MNKMPFKERLVRKVNKTAKKLPFRLRQNVHISNFENASVAVFQPKPVQNNFSFI